MIVTMPLALLALAQPVQATAGNPELDPYLWPELRDTVEAAAAAEADPKRGPGNAAALLEAEKKRHGSTQLRTALDLRLAGVMLRQRFLSNPQVPEPLRRAQALSTYSRLDLSEPGLAAALRGAAAISQSKTSTASLELKVALLGRTPGLDLTPFEQRLRTLLGDVGVRLRVVPPDEAGYLLKLGARDETAETGARVVSVRLDLAEQGGERWSRSMYRGSSAKTPESALSASIEWLARIGGRDLLFHYLSDGPIPELRARRDPHRGHHH